ncbi:hypothetical protein PRZ61_12740 [Halomonas pacifica]|uniref:hypothetical protein n=1 Tax=Bisbaumannia pacifica TaxID=77098 RepID=UPI002359D5CC|nr:hypothetical protein [Halomonas pacifica]MDC8804310.1 hypothetical protein [Halomonas pacifica]
MSRFLSRPLLVALSLWLAAPLALAEPALPAATIRDLEGLQQRLTAGERAVVAERAAAQHTRLAAGNAADRWAAALYAQLAARAEAAAGRHAAAADHLARARSLVEPGERHDRWLRREAELRLAADQTARGAELLEAWVRDHPQERAPRWRLVRALAELGRWGAAADWVPAGGSLDQQALAATVYQRAGRGGEALARLEARLERGADAATWRRAVGLAQRLGRHARAAALWEAGWREGVFAGREDLERRIRLHLAGGTPARAAELLEAALEEHALEDSLERRRLLAQAWEAARDREQALNAWRVLAEASDVAQDWLALGRLAYAWGRDATAADAWARAAALGDARAEAWLATLDSAEALD